MKGTYPCHRRSGGIARKNRCFRVYVDIPEQLSEDDIMKFIADCVRIRGEGLIPGFNKESVKCTRQTPKYTDLK